MERHTSAAKETRLPSNSGDARKSFTRISSICALAISSLLTKGVTDIYPPKREPEVIQRGNYYAPVNKYGVRILPSPDAPIEEIMYRLETPNDVRRFMEENIKYEYANFPVGFVSTYRRSSEEFQKAGWKGCCNNTAEFACEWGERQGYDMYLVSLWPKKTHERVYEPWHQMAVLCVQNFHHYIIFDNTQVVDWKGDLDSYISSKHPDMTTLPNSGQVEWRSTQDTFLGRVAGQIGSNVDQMKESILREPKLNIPMELAVMH